ncbi:E3 ubiquitin-protein ligase TRIM47-like [Boleophthalmus pectinirostris]|uniref:E3 ubiquitin-protein ligase TRIM47-like n=1 Tax=Boleophthalmus pectinirostris TaxID=150288 RepID=UPI000A1C5449|nr:E3 ubiquitin-protein ligase TRIM47-like [Boleophthalmus pectinirostris]
MSERPLCCICLEDFTLPVAPPCGHVFCLSCIGDYWRVQELCVCPLCKTCYKTRPQLQILHTSSSECGEGECDAELVPLRPGMVPCDLCPSPRAAVKSCVTCLRSFCPLHLQPHYQDAELGRHLLVGVVKNLEGALCAVHGRRLERFCKTDQTCICAVCAQTDHRGHRSVTVKREAAKKKVQLLHKQTKLAQTMQERLKEMEELKATTEIPNKDVILEVEGELCELQKRLERIEQLLHTEQSLHFIQRVLLTAPL